METYLTSTEKQTKDIAKKIIKNHKDERLFFLIGDLGVGKTVFAKGFAEALGIKENIKSPSYGVKESYDGFQHYDLYLAEGKVDISSILEEDLEDSYVLIEWADRLPNKFLENGVTITINILDNKREIVVK